MTTRTPAQYRRMIETRRAGQALPRPTPPRLPHRTSSDYCRTCGCAAWHWAGCEEGA